MVERCNCDASCGENRYHDVGDPGCRFRDDTEYRAYYHMKNVAPARRKKQEKQMPEPGHIMGNVCIRPWGNWLNLDIGKGYKVKRLEILPDMSISMQYHNHRSEWWVITQGEGKLNLDGAVHKVARGDSFYVPVGAIHRVTCTSLQESLIAIETQLGDICEEDDIVRV